MIDSRRPQEALDHFFKKNAPASVLGVSELVQPPVVARGQPIEGRRLSQSAHPEASSPAAAIAAAAATRAAIEVSNASSSSSSSSIPSAAAAAHAATAATAAPATAAAAAATAAGARVTVSRRLAAFGPVEETPVKANRALSRAIQLAKDRPGLRKESRLQGVSTGGRGGGGGRGRGGGGTGGRGDGWGAGVGRGGGRGRGGSRGVQNPYASLARNGAWRAWDMAFNRKMCAFVLGMVGQPYVC